MLGVSASCTPTWTAAPSASIPAPAATAASATDHLLVCSRAGDFPTITDFGYFQTLFSQLHRYSSGVQQVFGCGSLLYVALQAPVDDALHFGAELLRNLLVNPLLDLHCQGQVILSCEWRHQGAHLIEQAATGPDVRFLIVPVLVDQFWTHVVWSAYRRVGEFTLLAHHSSEPEVTELHITSGIKENIGGLDVAVEDLALLALMQIANGLDYLREELPNGVLWEVLSRGPFGFEDLGEIASFAILHDNVDLLLDLVDDAVVVLDDVVVLDFAKDVDFSDLV